MNTTIDHDNEETILQSSHRHWIENREREQQDRDKKAVVDVCATDQRSPLRNLTSPSGVFSTTGFRDRQRGIWSRFSVTSELDKLSDSMAGLCKNPSL